MPKAPPRPPSALEVDLVDDEFAVFHWQTGAPDAPTGLSEAEREVLAAIVRGESNAAIATRRGTSVRTVANQVASLLRKLGAASRYELIKRYAQTDLG